ncbi:MAG: GrdX family protein [Clostridiales bacterium]|jgi:hypothetical protein|nr:GrdX family protein [Clostridiales bacterium]
MKDKIITNNPLVQSKPPSGAELIFVDGGLEDVLTRARDLVHQGHALLTHPLSGSVKPGETVYKTIIMSRGDALDTGSLELIESAIAAAKKLRRGGRAFSDSILKDLQLVDYTLIFGKYNL